MPRSAARFTEADLRRAIRGVEKAGLSVARVDIGPDGRITITPKGAATPPSDPFVEYFGHGDRAA